MVMVTCGKEGWEWVVREGDVLQGEIGRDWLHVAGAGRAHNISQIKRKTETPEKCGKLEPQAGPASRVEAVA
jgi:hypothetical protein